MLAIQRRIVQLPGCCTAAAAAEDGFSYASVEISGFDPAAFCPADMVSRILHIFKPGKVSVSLSMDAAISSGEYSWGTLSARPHGYGCQSATCQELAAGGRVSYYTFSPIHVSLQQDVADKAAAAEAAAEAAKAAAMAEEDVLLRPKSPALTLRHMPSFSSLPSDSDLDLTSSGDENEANSRLAAALEQLRRNRSVHGSRGAQLSAAAAACVACNGSGMVVSSVAAAPAAALQATAVAAFNA